jgi:hypothetical protein
MTWATETDIPSRYRDKVTQDDLDLAQEILTPFIGITEDTTDQGIVHSKNLRLLRQAVVFQAIWLTAHPDVLTNMDVSSAGSDGVSAQYSNVNAQLMAPMAKRCIDRLTWRIRPLTVRKSRRDTVDDSGSRDSAAADDSRHWTPIPYR